MESKKIMEAMEDGIVAAIRNGDVFKLDYSNRLDYSDQLAAAYRKVDFSKVQVKITELLEEELARKVVNKIVTEMGTDIKKLMCNASVRDDFRYLLRRGVDDILERIKDQ